MAVTRRTFLAVMAGIGAALSPLAAEAKPRRRVKPRPAGYPLHYTTTY